MKSLKVTDKLKHKFTLHSAFISSLVLTVVLVTAYLTYIGFSFYSYPLEERYYHPQYDMFKPSGLMGHGLGIIGTLMIVIGVLIYILSKKYGILSKIVRLRFVLEFHIFLCTLGPILILFHTSFKFGGIVSIAFWSMVLVVLSGVIGRYIYIQIPRNADGEELSIYEISKVNDHIGLQLTNLGLSEVDIRQVQYVPPDDSLSFWAKRKARKLHMENVKKHVLNLNLDRSKSAEVMQLVEEFTKLGLRTSGLQRMQSLFKYWHVAHRPFALIMLVIVTIHVIVTLLFGYTWIS